MGCKMRGLVRAGKISHNEGYVPRLAEGFAFFFCLSEGPVWLSRGGRVVDKTFSSFPDFSTALPSSSGRGVEHWKVEIWGIGLCS